MLKLSNSASTIELLDEEILQDDRLIQQEKTVTFDALLPASPGIIGVSATSVEHYNTSNTGRMGAARQRLRVFIKEKRASKTPTLLRQIWRSDWTILTFLPMVGFYYAMRWTGYPVFGVLFFTLAVTTVDAILTIFVTRLSFHQNKSRFYQTEDYERDRLRYKVLVTLTKGVLFFIIGMKCGWTALIGAQIVWLFATTERLRYFVLRWSVEDTFVERDRALIFSILREFFGIQPSLRVFNVLAIVGAVLGIAVTLIF